MGYYLDTLNSFLEKMGIEKFYLAGHSIGAYISAFYFDKHPGKVIKLCLLSPAGFNPVDDKYHENLSKWM